MESDPLLKIRIVEPDYSAVSTIAMKLICDGKFTALRNGNLLVM